MARYWNWLLTALRPRPQAQISATSIAEIKKRMAGDGLTARELIEAQVRDATIAWSWANGSLLDYCTRPFPAPLSKKMQAWLGGLGYGQLVMLKNAGGKGIFEHVTGHQLIGGVPPLQPLNPAVVRYPPRPKTADEPRNVK